MEQKVLADLSGVNKTIKELAKDASAAASQVKKIGENLKFDPNNIKLVQQRFAELEKELQANSDLAKKYQSELDKLTTRQKELEGIKEEDRTKKQSREYEKLLQSIAKYNRELNKANDNVARLTAATKEKVQKDAEFRAATAKAKESLEAFNKVAKVASVAILAVAGAIAKAAKDAISLGTELYNLSIRYNTSVEEIQIWNRALQLATGQTELFTTAVNTMIKGLSQIAAGRGVAYRKALQNIGLAYKDLESMSTEERFRAIVDALGETTDANIRLEAAQQLLGESGQSIADMFEDEAFNLDKYLEEASRFGTLTQENAKALTETGFQWEYAKSEMQVATAQMTIALQPAITAVMQLITGLTKTLTDLGKALGADNEQWQRILVVIAVLLVAVPKLSKGIGGLVTWIAKLLPAIGAINIATAKWQIILLAISAAIVGIISLIALFKGKAKEAEDTMNDLANSANNLATAGADYGANVETVSTTNSYRRIEIDTTVRGEGNTPTSDEAARKVAQFTVDEMQKFWGDLIR